MSAIVAYELEKTGLLQKKVALALSKREHEIKLAAIKNLIRSEGMMPKEKYKQCCDSQNTHHRAIMQIEAQMAPIKTRLREIADAEYVDRAQSLLPKPPLNAGASEHSSALLRELVSLRASYQEFAADGTRVASMRTMAAEFALKLDKIIRQAVNP